MKKTASSMVLAEAQKAEKTIFLSHSHEDKDTALFKGLIVFLGNCGVSIWIDSEDSGLPSITNRETAQKIKGKISNLDFFIVLATDNALKSHWVPWEIGIADQCKKLQQIAIIPVVEDFETFQGNEYLQLYPRVVTVQGGEIGIFEPGKDEGKLFKNWLS